MSIGGLIGLTFGMISGLIGLIFGRQQAKKRRGLDEVHDHIWKTARSISWYTTLVAIYILLFLALFGLIVSLVKALSILLVVHLFSWGTVGAYLSANMYYEEKADRNLYHFLIVYFIVLAIVLLVITIFVV